MAVDRLGQADAPQRRRCAIRCRSRRPRAVGEALAHVVQQEVGIRPDQLKDCALSGASRRVTNFGVWQEAQPLS